MNSESQSSILIVDDNTRNLQVLSDILRNKNYKVAVAKDGVKALNFVHKKKPDIVLLDIMMPEIDGFEVCKRLKADEETRDIPVIFISALSDTSDKVKGFQAGGVDYIAKPFQKEEVFARVHTHLELRRSHMKLKKINEEITASIRYAQMIQSSLLPNPEYVSTYLPESFFLWMPKDIVAGDIFFTESFGDSFIVALMDCTGHGIPGAFMTMLAFSGLKRMVADEGCRIPSQILKHLNFVVKTTLRQDKDYAVSDDGLDAAVCFVKKESDKGDISHTLTFASAKVPLFYVFDNEVSVIKGDRQSLGYRRSDLDFEFTDHVISVKKGMRFYMASDGFEDQIGETRVEDSPFKSSRFGRERLRHLFGEISSLSFEAQKERLVEAFDTYKGKRARQDDVTVIGFGL